MIGGEFDLSIGSLIGFAGIVIGICVTTYGMPVWAAIIISLVLTTLTWAGAVAAGLWLLGSSLVGDLRRRPAAYPRVAESSAKETMDAGREP